jgi:E3 SUMO-protein ligase PIAS1
VRKLAAEDDDIEVGSSALSLKDPLSGMRIAKPIRSIRCGHLQCFDARWWLESNKSHPQWLCPHCSKELKFEEVICDGYFLSILSAVPDDYDEVTLESNGDWHTADGKYGTAEWVAKNAAPKPAATAAAATTVSLKRSRSPSMQGTPDKGKRRAIEILSDSDDDDMPILAKPNGHGGANGHHANGGGVSQPSSFRASSSAQPQAAPAVIDLTLSDSDDDEDESDGLVPQRNFQRPGVGSSSHGVAGSTAPRPASAALGSDVWDSIPFSSVRDLDDEEWGDFFNARQANGNVNGNVNGNGSGH